MKILTALLILALAAFTAVGKPVPKDNPKSSPPKTTAPNLTGETNWGKLVHAGRVISITGHPIWDAEGYVRSDGTVYLLWTLKSTGEPCPAVYAIVDKELRGTWGHAYEVRVEPDGTLTGNTHPDRVHPVEPPEPEFK